jgi:thiol-disulfide isomerase/thioredoxin
LRILKSKKIKKKNKMSSTAQIISNKDFNDFTTQGRGILIFTVSWCKSALMMSIIFDKLAEKYKGKLNFAKGKIFVVPYRTKKQNFLL